MVLHECMAPEGFKKAQSCFIHTYHLRHLLYCAKIWLLVDLFFFLHVLLQNRTCRDFELPAFGQLLPFFEAFLFLNPFSSYMNPHHPLLSSLSAGLTFVSVHDCFWTHALTVDTMNKVLDYSDRSSPIISHPYHPITAVSILSDHELSGFCSLFLMIYKS